MQEKISACLIVCAYLDLSMLLQASGMWEVSYHALHDPNWIVKQGKNSEAPVVCERLQPGTKYVFKARAGGQSLIKFMHLLHCTLLTFCLQHQTRAEQHLAIGVYMCSQEKGMSSEHGQGVCLAYHDLEDFASCMIGLECAELNCSVQNCFVVCISECHACIAGLCCASCL